VDGALAGAGSLWSWFFIQFFSQTNPGNFKYLN